MKCFVDLRGVISIESRWRFAWFDTEIERFEVHNGHMAWATWKEFMRDYRGRRPDRYRAICPDWVDTPASNIHEHRLAAHADSAPAA